MIEIKIPEEEEMSPNNHSREEAHSIIKLLVNAYNMGYKDGVEAYKTMMELEREEPSEWIVDTDDSRRWDRVRYYCSACNDWNTYGKSKYCPNCGAKMEDDAR